MRNASLIMKSTLPTNITWKQINWIHVNRYVEKNYNNEYTVPKVLEISAK